MTEQLPDDLAALAYTRDGATRIVGPPGSAVGFSLGSFAENVEAARAYARVGQEIRAEQAQQAAARAGKARRVRKAARVAEAAQKPVQEALGL